MVRIIIFTLFLVGQLLTAQDFQGIATYSTNRKIQFPAKEDSKISSEMQKQLQELMQKQFQKEYTLRFNRTESVYKKEESLSPTTPNSGVSIIVADGGSDILYKNSKEERFTSQRELFGKIFLVKDTLTHYNWKLTNDSKKIGTYTCYKATLTKQVKVQRSFTLNKEENKSESKTKEITVTAWYAPEIPVSNGPSVYWGLPGLIMEIHDGNLHVLCNKIVLNPKDKIEITAPRKGKEVTASKFKEIEEKKIKELQDRIPRGENSFEIRM